MAVRFAEERRQARILASRYRATLVGDAGTLLLLLVQAPVIAWLCTLVWGSVGEDTPSLYFVMCLAALWFGCINACREIVKERAILERERLFGLRLTSYVWSKVSALAWLGLAQVLLFQLVIERSLALRGPFLVQTAAMFGAACCGVGLGLVASAVARTQERAVGAIPLLILPQILFSELAIPREHFSDAVAFIEALMPVRWAWRVFTELAALETSWLLVAGSLVMLALYAALLAGAAVLALLPRRLL